MKYRCLTCGFVQDFEPTAESVVSNHPWMAGKNHLECPACHQYLAKGGRKKGKIQMPHFEACGVLEDEDKVRDLINELDKDHKSILINGDSTVAAKYVGKRLFGWTGDELLVLCQKNNS